MTLRKMADTARKYNNALQSRWVDVDLDVYAQRGTPSDEANFDGAGFYERHKCRIYWCQYGGVIMMDLPDVETAKAVYEYLVAVAH